MKNTQQDRFEKKLIRFMREFDKTPTHCIEDWDKLRSDLLRKYGFTDEEWYKACRLIRSWTSEENGLKKTKRYERKKMLRDRIKDITKSDNADNVNGEMELKVIDDWIADVYDN